MKGTGIQLKDKGVDQPALNDLDLANTHQSVCAGVHAWISEELACKAQASNVATRCGSSDFTVGRSVRLHGK